MEMHNNSLRNRASAKNKTTSATSVRTKQICIADNPIESRWRTKILIVPHMAPAVMTHAIACRGDIVSSPLSIVLAETIPVAPHRFNSRKLRLHLIELIAQPVDMNGDGSHFSKGIKMPDLFKKAFFGKDLVRMLCQKYEETDSLPVRLIS